MAKAFDKPSDQSDTYIAIHKLESAAVKLAKEAALH